MPRGWGGEDLAAFPRCEPSIVPLPQDESHSEWVSCVRFSPNSSNPIIVSCGWDKLVKVRWDLLPGQQALLLRSLQWQGEDQSSQTALGKGFFSSISPELGCSSNV